MVWNIKSSEKRVVELIPNEDWGGAGLLGVTIRLDNYGGADERLIRVLEVESNSPASIAGLVPSQDFLLGTTATSFGSTEILASVLAENIDQVIEIYVYNSESDVVRVAALMPTWSWGMGRGLLGAEVGTGYLHRLPNNCRDTIGLSIERKVRYEQTNKDSLDPSQPVMEPHLEMEEDEDSHQKPEERSKQAHELGTFSETKETTIESSMQKEGEENKSILQTQTVESVIQTTAVGESNNASADALNLFSGPPPATATKEDSNGSSKFTGIPSPPKMSY